MEADVELIVRIVLLFLILDVLASLGAKGRGDKSVVVDRELGIT